MFSGIAQVRAHCGRTPVRVRGRRADRAVRVGAGGPGGVVAYRGAVIETALTESLWPHGERPAPVPGETPAAYDPERYALAAGAPNGEGTERRADTDVHGQKRNLRFPALPEPLPHPVVDNHTHLDMQDGLVRVSVADAVATARDASVAGVVQAGCDVELSLIHI